MNKNIIDTLINKNNTKLLLVILDGLGGLPYKENKTELEYAKTPNMDKLAIDNEVGLSIPVEEGITPGSGPGHLGVFGYDPLEHQIGRGILEALGIDLNIDKTSIAARANFATIDKNDIIIDRRAGRISTEENKRLCKILSENIKCIDDYEIEFHSGIEHRFVFIIKNIKADADVTDTDPQMINKKPLNAIALNKQSQLSADIINKASNMIKNTLKNEKKANFALFRGISKMPLIKTMQERFSMKCACIASYPMYRGLARLVGMDILNTGKTIKDEVNTLKKYYNDYDYFFMHVKKTDSYGEDGDFDKKVKIIEEFDNLLPEIINMKFDVIAITGDHSTPSILKTHSYHYVPLLLIYKYSRKNNVNGFSEIECINGAIGKIEAKKIINLMLAGANRLKKYGA